MANEQDKNYANLTSPYDGNLQRIKGDLSSLPDATGASVDSSSDFNLGADTGADGSTASGSTANSQRSNGVEAGGIEEIASPAQVKSGAVNGQAVRDFWIDTWIKSTNYAPKARGFYIDGPRGYIECRDLFSNNAVISGTITALSGRIANWYINTNTLSSGPVEATSNVLIDSANSLIRLGPTSGNYLTLDGANIRLRSSNYVAGVSGFTVEPGLVEAENLVARGIMKGATFQYDVIAAVGGQVIVANTDVLASDMTALDASTLTVKGTSTFAVNDILIIRAITASGIQEEYLRVTNIGSAPTYTVTRDLAASYGANLNPIWLTGTTVVKQGKSDGAATYSGGWLRMLGEGTNAPHYSVFSRTGIAYNSYSERIRLGNLNGIGGQAVDTYGIFMGNYSTLQYAMYDDVSGLMVINGSPLSNTQIFGDGSDGPVDYVANGSLTADVYASSASIATGVTINLNGFRFFCKNTLTYVGTGKFAVNGGPAGNGANAANNAGGGGFGGAGGTAGAVAHNSGSLPGSAVGKTGGTGGGDGSANCNAGGAGVAGDAAVKALSGAGSAGGGGGDGSNGCTYGTGGGAAGAVTGTVFNKIRNFVAAFQLLDNFPTVTALSILSGSGSGAGGASGRDGSFTQGVGGGGGGGSGAGGGIAWVAARIVVTANGNNYIEAKGGAGGNGGNGGINTTATVCGGGGGGGGGGGRGGVIIEIYSSKSGTGTTSVAGGTKGTAGTASEGGSPGSNGVDGAAGVVISLVV